MAYGNMPAWMSSQLSNAEYTRMVRKRQKRQEDKKRAKLAELAATRAEIRGEIDRIVEEEIVEMENVMLERVQCGELRIRDLVGGVDMLELAHEFERTGNVKLALQRFAVGAVRTVAQSLESEDEKVRLASAKMILDGVMPSKEQEAMEASKRMVVMPAIVLENGQTLDLKVGK